MVYFIIIAAVIVVFLAFRSGSSDPHAWDVRTDTGEDAEEFDFMEDMFEEVDIFTDPTCAGMSCNLFHTPGKKEY